MRKPILLLAVLMLICLTVSIPSGLAEPAKTRLTIYEGPKTMASSKTALVSVNGYDLFVYDVMVNHDHFWNANTRPTTTPRTYFDFEGKVRISIQMPGLPQPVESAVVQPYSSSIDLLYQTIYG